MSEPIVKGALQSCPCPHGCGFKLDFSDVQASLVDAGSVFSCDKCKKMVEIVGKSTVTILSVRKTVKTGGGLQKRG